MKKKPQKNFADIQLLIMDVDGVLTDGTVEIYGDGSEGKSFSLLDGHGIKMWKRAGLKTAFLSGRFSKATAARAKELDIDYCLQDCFDKLPAVAKLLEESQVQAKNAAYIGDDLMDLPVIRYVGFGAAVANAVDEVKKEADYITARAGGAGAVREVIEYILKNAGKWQGIIKKYMSDSEPRK